MIEKTLWSLALMLCLSACIEIGDDSSTDDDEVAPSSAQEEVTSTNISSVLEINGATPLTNEVTIPDSLSGIEASSADEVVVTANSRFKMTLAVDEADVPAGKKVGGYLLELPGGDQLFVAATDQAGQRSENAVDQRRMKKPKRKGGGEVRDFTPSTRVNTVANTEIDINGWSSSEFFLDTSIEALIIKILPLLVDEGDLVESLSDINLADSSTWLGVQELVMSVIAVATNPIQATLTWNTATDLDLWVVEPDQNTIIYYQPTSSTSLGWLDFDDIDGYGPENITYNYKMPEGSYKVYVHYFDGDVDTDYSVTLTINGTTQEFSGSFAGTVSNDDTIGGDSVDEITSFTVDADLNATLTAPISLADYVGVWKSDDEAGFFIEILSDRIDLYAQTTDGTTSYCEGSTILQGNKLPTGLSVENGNLVVTAKFLGAADSESDLSYEQLVLSAYVKPDNCTLQAFHSGE